MAFGLSPKSLARRSAARPWLTIGIWGLLLIVAFGLIITLMGDALTTDIGPTGNPESEQAQNLVNERFSGAAEPSEVTEIVLVRSTERTVEDPLFQSYIEGLFADISALGPDVIPSGTHYYQSGDESLVSLDRHTTAMILSIVPGQENWAKYFDVYISLGQDPWPIPADPLDPDRGKGEFSVHSFSAREGGELVIISSSKFATEDSEYRQFVEGLFYDIVALGRSVVWGGINYTMGEESLVSGDGHATIMPFILGDSDRVGLIHAVIDNARSNSDFDISITGNATINKDFNDLSANDLKSGELQFGLPIAVFILILVFGALAAAAIPLAVAIVSIIVALGLSMLFAQAMTISIFLMNMVFMMGLAVGIDYCLFIIARFREERARGLEKNDAIERTGATASQAVLFSGVTVFLALIALILVPHDIFVSLGLGAVLAVSVTIVASLTLLPAVLSLMGDRVNRLRIPFVYKIQAKSDAQGSGGMWDRISRTVMRAPVISILLGAGLLIAAATPIFDMNTGTAGISSFPDSLESKRGFLALEQDFSAGLVSLTAIVIDGDIDSPVVQGGIDNLQAAMAPDDAFGDVVSLRISPQRDLAILEVPVGGGDASSEVAMAAVERLREDYIPAAFADVPARALVAGETAMSVDMINIGNDGMRIIIPFILVMSFILLMVVFRSLIVPVKAVILNLLSVAAAYGLLVLVFQKGVGNELFGFQQVDSIDWWVPAFLFAVLFGLSMDYHVFLLSRIRERFFQTHDNTGSVAYGIRTTGRLITGAALIMVAVFVGFAAGDLVMFQQMGFGLAVSVLLDATIVRSVLVPASMKLLGSWNWYLPRWLNWLPKISTEE